MDKEIEQVYGQVQNFLNFISNKTRKVGNSKAEWTREEVMRLMYDISVQSEALRHFIDVREKKRKEAEEREQRARLVAKMEEERKEWLAGLNRQKPQEWNTRCRHHCISITRATGEETHSCDIEMPLEHCGNNCPYATNMVCSTKVIITKRRTSK